jgi:uncharacterized protein
MVQSIIDFRIRLRTPQLLKAWAPEPEPCFENYVRLYKMSSRLTFQSIEETVGEMEAAGIGKAVVCAGHSDENEYVLEACSRFPDKLVPVTGVRLDKVSVTTAYKSVKKALTKDGFKGVSLGPYLMNLHANHKKLYPIYAICDDLGRPVIIHSSLHYNTQTPMDLGDPRYFDEIAVDFPNMKIVMSHAGVGFGVMALAIAQRHENVYMEVSALYPEYMNPMFLRAFNSYLKDKVVFATDYPLVPFTICNNWKEVIKPENWDRFFSLNAQRIIGA